MVTGTGQERTGHSWHTEKRSTTLGDSGHREDFGLDSECEESPGRLLLQGCDFHGHLLGGRVSGVNLEVVCSGL